MGKYRIVAARMASLVVERFIRDGTRKCVEKYVNMPKKDFPILIENHIVDGILLLVTLGIMNAIKIQTS
jgi:hypothetical protein